jgi:UDPglucose--hexose-1-phosphate uridylyltransferase
MLTDTSQNVTAMITDNQSNEVWEERWHPLREEWVIVAAHRQGRPWSGQTVKRDAPPLPRYVEDCYLCPGNDRVSGEVNPPYEGVFVFDNDHPCVGINSPLELDEPQGIFRNRPARGISRVVCYTPRHDLSLAQLETVELENLLATWQSEYVDLGRRSEIDHVLIFENKGEVVGVSNPHPHCQIYGTNFVFKTIETEARASERHLSKIGRPLFQDIIASEQADGRRIICENESAIAFVPYFARYAYEVFVAPKRTHPSLAALSDGEVHDLASVLGETLIRFDNLWQMPFPYVMPLHQAPTDGGDYRSFHFHIEFHPPLRKPNLLKYLAGPEIGGGNFLSDTAPEHKAAELRVQSTVHYLRSPDKGAS